jgi:3-hydroxyisobutyrate dehydrogenase-like beta-hydroxyacid dehydrogenase
MHAAQRAACVKMPGQAIRGMVVAQQRNAALREESAMETVGFIGLGNMGSGMAGNIQKADYPMVVFDLRLEITRPFVDRGARVAASPAEVARQSDVIFTSLPGPKEVEAVATGAQGISARISMDAP